MPARAFVRLTESHWRSRARHLLFHSRLDLSPMVHHNPGLPQFPFGANASSASQNFSEVRKTGENSANRYYFCFLVV